jgi:dihydrofolate synthase / folylpolyglutamate synthase
MAISVNRQIGKSADQQIGYDSAVAQLYELGHELAAAPARKFDLAHMCVLLQAMGSPQQRFRSVLIAGTNGKGSTAATLASILGAAGHRAGLYTSPHLVRINERIRIDGQRIGDADFAAAWQRVEDVAAPLVDRGALPWHPSFFEMLTAMAFDYFARRDVEIAVLEVGMGGRLDATNVVEPLVSVITDISLDHQKYLGDTIAQIAREKAGIIRPRGTVVTLPQHPEANDVLGRAILEADARAVSAVPYMPPLTPPAEESRAGAAALGCPYWVDAMGKEICIESPLIGRHQLRNVALAIATAVELNQAGVTIAPEDIARGVRETRWPGRFQVVPGEPELLFDVAHNPAGAWALRAALSARYSDRKLVFVFGAMRDKAIAEMASILFPLAVSVVATRAENPRSAVPAEICGHAQRTGTPCFVETPVTAALARARQLAGKDGVVVVTGSIYVAGEALRELGMALW